MCSRADLGSELLAVEQHALQQPSSGSSVDLSRLVLDRVLDAIVLQCKQLLEGSCMTSTISLDVSIDLRT